MNASTVRVGIVGTGNCASSFVQGLCRDTSEGDSVPGLTHATIGRYGVRNVEIACAFDVHAGKAGRDLAEAPGALEAGRACVPCIPGFIASNADWGRRLEQARLRLLGDDNKSPVGATIVQSYLKSPPQQFPDHVARQLTPDFIRRHSAQEAQPAVALARADRGHPEHDHEIHARAARHVRAD